MKSKKQILRGRDLYLLAGLPRNSFNFAVKSLSDDKNRSPARYRGTPAPISDWAPIYPEVGITELLAKAGQSLAIDDTDFSPGDPSLPTPRRIILLYVPSADAERLLQAMDFFCYPAPLNSTKQNARPDQSPIAWRQNPHDALTLIKDTIDGTRAILNELKAEVTDKVICPLALPAENFHFPTSNSRIGTLYREVRRSGDLPPRNSSGLPSPTTFHRNELSPKAFKNKAHTDRFFEDARGLAFPPDPHHGVSRPVSEKGDETGRILLLRQRYRFGVYVRDGNLHFDAQYRNGRNLTSQPMHCGAKGRVFVSGSHANIGINGCHLDAGWVL